MSEESLGFYMLILPFVLSAGFDKLVGIMMILFGVEVGCLASSVNPFVVSVAVQAFQHDADLANFTASNGMAFR